MLDYTIACHVGSIVSKQTAESLDRRPFSTRLETTGITAYVNVPWKTARELERSTLLLFDGNLNGIALSRL